MHDDLSYIRRMLNVDVTPVSHIEHAAQIHPWNADSFRTCLQSDYDCYVLEKAYANQRDIMGFIIWQTILDECHLLNICIDPKLQNQGWGQHLLDFMISETNLCGVKNIFLEVRANNAAAIYLYEQKNQFTRQGIRKAYYQTPEGREDAILLKKNIEPA